MQLKSVRSYPKRRNVFRRAHRLCPSFDSCCFQRGGDCEGAGEASERDETSEPKSKIEKPRDAAEIAGRERRDARLSALSPPTPARPIRIDRASGPTRVPRLPPAQRRASVDEGDGAGGGASSRRSDEAMREHGARRGRVAARSDSTDDGAARWRAAAASLPGSALE